MAIKLHRAASVPAKQSFVILVDGISALNKKDYSNSEFDYISQGIKNEKKVFVLNRFPQWGFVQLVDKKLASNKLFETLRKAGNDLAAQLNERKIEEISISYNGEDADLLSFCEGVVLGSYQFLKYRTTAEKEKSSLKKITLVGSISKASVEELEIITESVILARDLINEPVCELTAQKLSKEIGKYGKQAGFKVEVLSKSRIEALKMGGLLAVNKGSIEPPTFTIMEYKPAKAKNKKPLVFVGKGVTYDTGGLSLKPTANSMDLMKSDMAGAAAVVGAIHAIAKAKIPYHVIALVPATDNRPGGDAYAPGDIITLHNGKTVEVLNTDAEGRLILGDALSYAQKYKPELVIDLATLTGAAVAAIGPYGIVAMTNGTNNEIQKLKESGDAVHERLAEMPFWEDYGELVKSEIADIKNLGGPYGGAITAGKFLEHFTSYPWIHLDIAGPSYITTKDSYRGKGGTGVGVRLLYNFVKNLSA